MIARKGNKVRVHYTGTLKDGTVFDSSLEREPLEFVVGAGQMISGFDRGVEGMNVGEERTLSLSPAEAYGTRDEELLFRISREVLPQGYTPEKGDTLQLVTEEGYPMSVTISEIEDEHVLLDGNHRLAGEELVFVVRLVEVVGQ